MTKTPKLPPLPMRTINVAMPDDLLDQLDEIGAITDTPRSALVREAVSLWLSLHDSPLEVLGGIVAGLEQLHQAADQAKDTAGTA